MSKIISKELLSAVLDVDDIEVICIAGDEVHFNGYLARDINIYELAFHTRDFFKKKAKHLTLNQSIEDIFKEAHTIYEKLKEGDSDV